MFSILFLVCLKFKFNWVSYFCLLSLAVPMLISPQTMEWLNKKTEHGYDSGNPFSSRTHYFPFFLHPSQPKKICFHYAQEFTCNTVHVVSPDSLLYPHTWKSLVSQGRRTTFFPYLTFIAAEHPEGVELGVQGQQWCRRLGLNNVFTTKKWKGSSVVIIFFKYGVFVNIQ